jgi:hypothetical protein
MPDPTSLLEIGARLGVTRKALGLTQAEMDRRMGSALTNGQTFNVYEIACAANGAHTWEHWRAPREPPERGEGHRTQHPARDDP